FQGHLQGRPHTFHAPRSETVPEFETLASSAKEVDDWYASYVAGLPPGEFEQPLDFVFTSGKQARMRRGEILMHVCLQGTYHRGNSGAVLRSEGLSRSWHSWTDYREADGRLLAC